jgi:hypothetical protein
VFDRVDGFAFLDVPFDSASITHQPLLFRSVCGGFVDRHTCSPIGKRPRRKRVHLPPYPGMS